MSTKLSQIGFSLIEILVVIALVALITVAAVPNLRRFSDSVASDNAASELIQQIRQAQSNSQTKVQCPNGVNSTQYWNFEADLLEATTWNYRLVAGCAMADGTITEIESKQFTLKAPVALSSIEVNDGTVSTACDNVKIQFQNNGNKLIFISPPCAAVSASIINVKLAVANSITSESTSIQFEKGGTVYRIE